ncbi:MAG TPA: hypothetical protein VGR35_15660 [Tepidisphaeraceae bacterium]|nr:hypothetical protein [Tepidisphaeraceae bacterium]
MFLVDDGIGFDAAFLVPVERDLLADLPADLVADFFVLPPRRDPPLDCFDRLALPLPLFLAMRDAPFVVMDQILTRL